MDPKHQMIKNIYEQPQIVKNLLTKKQKSLSLLVEKIRENPPDNVFFIGCSTSLFAGMTGACSLQSLSSKPVFTFAGSYFTDCVPVSRKDLIVFFSRSGESGDILAALQKSIKNEGVTVAVTDNPESTLGKKSRFTIQLMSGQEGLVMIKSYIGEVTISNMLALELSNSWGKLSKTRYLKYKNELLQIPKKVKLVTESIAEETRRIAEKFAKSENIYLIGYGPNYATALEGMLKIRECLGVHAEAIEGNEFRHGYINSMKPGDPVIGIFPPSKCKNKMIKICRNIKNMKGQIVIIGHEKDEELRKIADDYVSIGVECDEFFSPILYILPLQLLAYYGGLSRGIDPDYPPASEAVGRYKDFSGKKVYYIEES